MRSANADRLAGDVLDGAVAIADVVRDEDVHAAIDTVVRERVESTPLAPVAGRALRFVTQDGRHDELVDAALRGSTPTSTSIAPSSAIGWPSRRRGGCRVQSRIGSSSGCSMAERSLLEAMVDDRDHDFAASSTNGCCTS